MAGITEQAREYAEKNVSLATSMYNPQAETIAAYSFIDGYKVALEKAREIIKDLKALYLSPIVTNDDVKRQDKILAAAEQFLAGGL